MDDNERQLAEEAVRRFVDAQLRGQEPDLDALVSEHPELEAQIRERIRRLQRINGLFDSLAHATEEELESAGRLDGPVLAPGMRIGEFRIERELGRGGAGVVYLAHDTKLDRPVAIKSVPADVLGSPRARSRLMREARLLASLNHPNIAVIYEALEQQTEGQGYLVLEYVRGETLSERISSGPLSLQDALSIGEQVGGALAAAHQHGVIHRDLKPGNIKITSEGTVKVLDFGSAKMMPARRTEPQTTGITQAGLVVGTPAYMSPEQARGAPLDARTDIWSFGCTLFKMLAGRSPLPGDSVPEALAAILKAEPDWAALPRGAGPTVRRILARCLEKDPNKRYPSAAELHHDISKCLEALTAPAPKPLDARALLRWLQKPRTAVSIGLTALLLAAGSVWLTYRTLTVRWARLEALPHIIELMKDEQYLLASLLAERAEKYIPNDPVLTGLWPEMSREASITTQPPGASIFLADYRTLGEQWGEPIGRTPLVGIRIPFVVHRVKVTKPGFETREFLLRGYGHGALRLDIELYEIGAHPPEMVPISQWMQPAQAPLPTYFIDKHEVTNEQFKRFVDAGGYETPDHWRKCRFVEGQRELSWEQAKDRFRDRTKRHGPATWEGGTYPAGQDKHPVGGVSWYEAVAYATFAGKTLPTKRHWELAARSWESQSVMAFSNFGLDGAMPAGSTKAITSTGVYDMAGNVKEWCWNATDTSETRRHICGGSWGEPTYMFSLPDGRSPWARKRTFGFRCVLYPDGDESIPKALFGPVGERAVRDFGAFQPASRDELTSWLNDLYRFDRGEVQAVCDSVDDSSPFWRKERILFDAVYEDEQIIAYLFLPKGVNLPYQPVIYFPGLGVFNDFPSAVLGDFNPLSLIIKSGRAALYPVYKGSYERYDREKPFQLSDPVVALQYGIQWTKDLRRSVDYLRTRNDLDMSKLTYCGWSVGAGVGPVMAAVEDRIRFAILVHGGLYVRGEFLPRGEPANFAPHVKVPVLMVNGSEDFLFPLKASQESMFRLLGSADKKHVLHPGGHVLWARFSPETKNEIFAWMDGHLGPVK
jgi:serine/threonine protein kinase/dienelactone hydrolase